VQEKSEPASTSFADIHCAKEKRSMRFLSIYKTAERSGPPCQEERDRMVRLIEEGLKAGWLLGTEGCLPSELGARVRRTGGEITVTDGPFAESKEVVGGFALLEVQSKAEAVELTRRFLSVSGDGECELRQLYEAPEAEKSAAAS